MCLAYISFSIRSMEKDEKSKLPILAEASLMGQKLASPSPPSPLGREGMMTMAHGGLGHSSQALEQPVGSTNGGLRNLVMARINQSSRDLG